MTTKKLLLTILCISLCSVNLFAQSLTIVLQPQSGNYCRGDVAILKVETTGGQSPITYKWQKSADRNGAYTDIPSAETQTIEFTSIDVGDSGFYRCLIEDGLSVALISDTADIFVAAGAPSISGISADHTSLCQGESNTLTAEVDGDITTRIEWHKDGRPLQRYGNTYSFYNAVPGNEGNYYVVATNVCNIDVTSEIIEIDIIDNPRIETQLQSRVVCEGDDVTLSATATGDDLTYSWLRDGTEIPGAINNILIIPDISRGHNYFYKMVANNECSSDTTIGAYITVKIYPEITQGPHDTIMCEGFDLTYTANANTNRDDPVEYQWYFNNSQIEGEVASRLTFEVSGETTGAYFCAISNSCGTENTDTANVVIRTPIFFERHPEGDIVCEGDNLSLNVKVVGDDPISYHWFKDGFDILNSNVTGQNSQVLSITGIYAEQSGLYYCRALNSCGSLNSDTVEVVVNRPVRTSIENNNIEVCEGGEININPINSGTEPLGYEWFKLNYDEVLSTESSFNINSAIPDDSGRYYSIISNICGDISTDTIDVLVKALPAIVTQPDGIDACEGDAVDLTVVATGYEPVYYEWYRNGSVMSGYNTNTLSYSGIQLNQSGEYYCKVWNTCGNTVSDTVEVPVSTPPVFGLRPLPQTICEFDTIRLYTTVSGVNYNLQWYCNNQPVNGQNDTVLIIEGATMENGGMYYCSAFNSCGTLNTDPVMVTINEAPSIDIGDDVEKCEGELVVLSTEGDFMSYNWNNGSATTPTFTAEESGTYILEVISRENYCKNRDTVEITYHPYFPVNLGRDRELCENSTVLNAGEGAYSYSWSNGQATSSITVNQSGNYAVTVTGSSFGCETRSSVNVDLKTPVDFTLGDDKNVPLSSSFAIGVEALPDYESYLWNTGFTGPSLFIDGAAFEVGSYTYWLKITGMNGCYDSDTIVITFYEDDGSSVELNDVSKNIMIYPNPSEDYVNIINDNGDISGITVFNNLGEQIFNKTIKDDIFTLDVTTFAAGIYYIKVVTGKNEIYIEKLIKP